MLLVRDPIYTTSVLLGCGTVQDFDLRVKSHRVLGKMIIDI